MITIKTAREIEKLAQGGKILAEIITQVSRRVEPGVNLLELEKLTDTLITKRRVQASFKNYQNYPSSICLSVNSEVVHCVPRDYIIKEGDIISLDLGIKHQGLFTDMAITVPVGMISLKVQKLIQVTKKSLQLAIKQVKPGNTIGDIGYTIDNYVSGQGFFTVKQLVGHGVGYAVHEEPRIPNFGIPGRGPVLKPGMVIAIEPMVNIGTEAVNFESDGWRVVTQDKSYSAHFEHTIVVTPRGAKILTQ